MATLTGNTISSTYPLLLKIDSGYFFFAILGTIAASN